MHKSLSLLSVRNMHRLQYTALLLLRRNVGSTCHGRGVNSQRSFTRETLYVSITLSAIITRRRRRRRRRRRKCSHPQRLFALYQL
ncbi:hypothetical protein FIBSPDRAFT_87703 [Athelia psychrophila]|uniref:Uncharacterized protein n=1 Tax=Athelia psychrophila TaxID=1759441 RepID=A0A166DY74_9AGAM|nr:hypothetical protein FIBSPDRAFT_87703 [Fibularhizoctonia sp. CBS 109695]